ncbi:hypothetical protein AX15_001700 [Amanita polypyramis BW_CC]|nr:hypothetical protein AX15_001700 [Amanita polypyramis BW_CC]
MSRSPSPTPENPFDTPTSTRPPSLLSSFPTRTTPPPGNANSNVPVRGSSPQLSRPSTGVSIASRLDGLTSGASHNLSRPSTGNSSLSASNDAMEGSIVITSRKTPTTQQPFIRSMLNARPNSTRSNTVPFSLPTSPLGPSFVLSTKSKASRMPSHLISADVPVSKPWLEKPRPRGKLAYFLTYAMIFVGLAGGVVQTYFRYAHAQLDRKPLCLVFEENFDNEDAVFGPNGTFQREVNLDGFGNGEFEMTTASTNNSYVQDGFLYIVPTLTADNIGWDAVFNGTVFNITGCTFNETSSNNGYIIQNGAQKFDEAGYLQSCSAVSNSTSGTVINPAQSARITTRKSASVKFGRVEIRAKMPNGQVLWPAIWMLPVNSVYGPWPRSGEIDIVESRGNGIQYTARGSNYVQGSLNWGPTVALNSVSKTYSWWTDRRKSFGSGFHTYALEWTEQFLYVLYPCFSSSCLDLFNLGEFISIRGYTRCSTYRLINHSLNEAIIPASL